MAQPWQRQRGGAADRGGLDKFVGFARQAGDNAVDKFFPKARFAHRDGNDADGNDREEIEGGGANNRARAERARLEPSHQDLDDAEQDLRCRRAYARGQHGRVERGAWLRSCTVRVSFDLLQSLYASFNIVDAQ